MLESPDFATSTDPELIAACLEGNEQAWNALIERYSRLMYAIPLRFGFTEMVAEEMFQEVCLKLLNNLDSLHTKQRLSAWITTVTKRLCIDMMRRARDEAPLDDYDPQDDAPHIERAIVDVEQVVLLRQAISAMPERCRVLLTALFLDESPPAYDALAAQLGIRVGSIGPTRKRCINKLRDQMLDLDSA